MHISKNILAFNSRTIQIITVVCCLVSFNKNISYCDNYNNNINNVSNTCNTNYEKFLNTSSNDYSQKNNNRAIKSKNHYKCNNITKIDSSNCKDNINRDNVQWINKKYDNEFNIKLNRYIKLAKKVSASNRITTYNIHKLLENALIVLDHIKFNNLYKKFNNINEIIFNSTRELYYSNEFEEKIIKFTMSFFHIFTTLNKKHILDIITQSPLELVPLLREMNVFAKFITTNAKEHGYDNFSVHYATKDGNICKININKNILIHIMGNLIKKYLISKSGKKTYKLSNIASAFYRCNSFYNYQKNNNINEITNKLYENTISKLNRNYVLNKSRIVLSL